MYYSYRIYTRTKLSEDHNVSGCYVSTINQDYVCVLRILNFESNDDPILSSGARITVTSGVQPTGGRGEGGHRRNVVFIS